MTKTHYLFKYLLILLLFPLSLLAQKGGVTGLSIEDKYDYTPASSDISNVTKKRNAYKDQIKGGIPLRYMPAAINQKSNQSCAVCALIHGIYNYGLCLQHEMASNQMRINALVYYCDPESDCDKRLSLKKVFAKSLDMKFPLYDNFDDEECKDMTASGFNHLPTYQVNTLHVNDLKNLAAPDEIRATPLLKINNIKLTINQEQPVLFVMDAPPSLITGQNDQNLWYSTDEERKILDYDNPHVMIIVEYNDEYLDSSMKKHGNFRWAKEALRKTKNFFSGNLDKNYPGKGAFKVLNSYGTEYGLDGYIWIPYEEFEKRGMYAYTIDVKKIEFKKLSPGIEATPTPRKDKFFLVTISDETLNNRKGRSKVNDRKNMEFEFEKIASAIDYELKAKNFIGNRFNKATVKKYIDGLNPSKNDIVVVYYRGDGVAPLDSREYKALGLDKPYAGIPLIQSLEQKGNRFNLLITDFSNKYNANLFKRIFNKKAIIDEFDNDKEEVLAIPNKSLKYIKAFFEKSKGSFWLSSHKQINDSNYAIPKLGNYFNRAILKAFATSKDMRQLVNLARSKNQAYVDVRRKKEPYPVIMYPDKKTFDTMDLTVTTFPDTVINTVAVFDEETYLTYQNELSKYEQIGVDFLEAMLSIEPRLQADSASFDERVLRIEEIKSELSRKASNGLRIIVQENETTITDFNHLDYLERLKGSRITDIEVLDFTIDELGKVDTIRIVENFPIALQATVNQNAEAFVEKYDGIAKRALKEIYYFYDCIEGVTKEVGGSPAAVQWGQEQLIHKFEAPDQSTIQVCNYRKCDAPNNNCIYSPREYATTVLPESMGFHKNLNLEAGSPVITSDDSNNHVLFMDLTIDQSYDGKNYEDNYRKTFGAKVNYAKVEANGVEFFVIKDVVFSGIGASCEE